MATENFDFEIISEEEVEKSPRGRKSSVDPKLVAALGKLKKGQAVRIRQMQADATSTKYTTDKARISAQIRVAMRAAGHSDFSIVFTKDGIPQVVVR